MRIRLAFHNSRTSFSKTDKISAVNLGIFENEFLRTRYDAIRSSDLTSGSTLIDPIYVCNLAKTLSSGFKTGDYKIKISREHRDEDGGSSSTNWMGYWIDELTVKGMPIIGDRKSLIDKLDLRNPE
jgi:hypothetical protein